MLFTKNEVIEGNGFYVSYLPHSSSSFGMFSGDNSSSETALVKDGKFLILNGDFREKYRAAISHGYDACLDIYEANKAHSSSWSD